MIGSSKLLVVLAVCLLSLVHFNDAKPTTEPTVGTKDQFKCFSFSGEQLFAGQESSIIDTCSKCCQDNNYDISILLDGNCLCDYPKPVTISTTVPPTEVDSRFECFSMNAQPFYGELPTTTIGACEKCCHDNHYVVSILEGANCYCQHIQKSTTTPKPSFV